MTVRKKINAFTHLLHNTLYITLNSLERYGKTSINLHTSYAADLERTIISHKTTALVCLSYASLLRKRLFTRSQAGFRHAGGAAACANIIIIFNYTSSAASLHFEATIVVTHNRVGECDGAMVPSRIYRTG